MVEGFSAGACQRRTLAAAHAVWGIEAFNRVSTPGTISIEGREGLEPTTQRFGARQEEGEFVLVVDSHRERELGRNGGLATLSLPPVCRRDALFRSTVL